MKASNAVNAEGALKRAVKITNEKAEFIDGGMVVPPDPLRHKIVMDFRVPADRVDEFKAELLKLRDWIDNTFSDLSHAMKMEDIVISPYP